MAKGKFAKGQKVVIFNQYNPEGACLYTKLIVKSCGIERMTLEHTQNGKMIKHFIYARDYCNVYLLSDFVDESAIVSKGLEYSEQYIAKMKAHYELRLSTPTNTKGYHEAMRDGLEAVLKEPKAISYEQMREELNAKFKV